MQAGAVPMQRTQKWLIKDGLEFVGDEHFETHLLFNRPEREIVDAKMFHDARHFLLYI